MNNQAIALAVKMMRGAVDQVTKSFPTKKEQRLSPAEQMRRYKTMTPIQRFQIQQKVGAEEYARYEETMRQLIQQGW